jgi:hypothetical protein
MRTRRFLPMVDGLDRRLLLDATAVTATTSTAPVYGDTSGSNMPGDEIDPVEVLGWNGSGDPPADSDDPTDPTDDDASN